MGLWANKIAFESLEARLRELEHRCDRADHHAKILRLEWEETYDKVSHQMARMSRRAKADAKLNGNEPPLDPVIEPDDGVDPISKSIMMRRGMSVRPK